MTSDLQEAEPRGTAAPASRVHPFFRDLSVTLLAQGAVAVGGLFLYRLLAMETGTTGFASYSLVKQTASILFPVVTFGLVAGLPRYVALLRTEESPSAEAYVAAAAVICATANAMVATLALALPDLTAGIFFGDSSRSGLVVPLVALMGATTLFYVAYGYYRGLLRLRGGSLLQVAAMAVAPPLVVLILSGQPIRTLILVIAAVIAGFSLLAVAGPLLRSLKRPHRTRILPAGRALFDYGHRRVPGELAQLGVFVLVPVLAAHVASLTDVAHLSAGQQVLGMVMLAVQPLGLILLPSLTRMWSEDRERAAVHVGQLASFACHLALFLSVQALLFADIAVGIWLGPKFSDADAVIRVVVAPAALWAVYLTLRSTLDAVAVKSYNSRNSLVAFLVFASVAAVMLGLDLARPVMCVAWAFATAIVALGSLTFVTVHRLFAIPWSNYTLPLALPLSLLTAGIGFAARPLVDGSAVALPMLVVVQLALAALYFGAIAKRGAPWTRMLGEQFFQRR